MMSENTKKNNPQQQLQEMFSEMVNQTSSMLSPGDPLGAMKPMQQVAKPGLKTHSNFPRQCSHGLSR